MGIASLVLMETNLPTGSREHRVGQKGRLVHRDRLAQSFRQLEAIEQALLKFVHSFLENCEVKLIGSRLIQPAPFTHPHPLLPSNEFC